DLAHSQAVDPIDRSYENRLDHRDLGLVTYANGERFADAKDAFSNTLPVKALHFCDEYLAASINQALIPQRIRGSMASIRLISDPLFLLFSYRSRVGLQHF